MSKVSVTIVTCNSQRYIGKCLDAVLNQDCPVEVIVVDNASLDETRLILARYQSRVRIIHNPRNIGFAAAQNQAIAQSRSKWVLTLNPDVLLHSGFVSNLVEAGESDLGVGTVCGRLRRIGVGFNPLPEPVLDSTGIYFTPNLRHFDRGSGEPDDDRYSEREYVFGASAAAAMYRRQMIDDISSEDGFFDPDFFAYREDADVSWRAQLLGWRCLYTPGALGQHVRRVRPGSRRDVPKSINMHSVKNRFLMRVKNTTTGIYTRHWLSITTRDLFILGGCLFYEPTSLPALWRFFQHLPKALAKRRQIMEARKIDDKTLAAWFSPHPHSLPVPVAPALPRETKTRKQVAATSS